MINILAEVSIEDINKFISIFATTGVNTRGMHGSKGSKVFKHADDNTRVIVLFEWDSRKGFEGFLRDAIYPELLRSAGVKSRPTYTFVERLCEFPA